MKVLMKAFEKAAVDYASRFKDWSLQCVAKDAYMAGYQQAIKDIEATGDYNDYDMYEGWSNFGYNLDIGQQEVEVEFKDGTHQLTDDMLTHSLKDY